MKKEYPPLTGNIKKVVEDAVKSEILSRLNSTITSELLYEKGILHKDHQGGFTTSFKSIQFYDTPEPVQSEDNLVKYYFINWSASIWLYKANSIPNSHRYKEICGSLKVVELKLVRKSGIKEEWDTSFVKLDFNPLEFKECR